MLPVCLLEPVWEQFAALLPERPVVAPGHPLGCHRPRVPDRVVFEHAVAALVHGSGYERIASPGCSDRTIRRRVKEWAGLGLMEWLHARALEQYDRLIGLELEHVCADGCITNPSRLHEYADPERIPVAVAEHRAIYEALVAHDPELAERLAREHTRHALRAQVRAQQLADRI